MNTDTAITVPLQDVPKTSWYHYTLPAANQQYQLFLHTSMESAEVWFFPGRSNNYTTNVSDINKQLSRKKNTHTPF